MKTIFIFIFFINLFIYQNEAQQKLQKDTEQYFENCNISQQELDNQTPKQLQTNGGWDIGTRFPILQEIGDQKTIYRIKLSDEEFFQGFNMKFEIPQVLKGEQQYRPQIRAIIKQFHKKIMSCNYGNKLVTTIQQQYEIINNNRINIKQQSFQQQFSELLVENNNQKQVEDFFQLQDQEFQNNQILEGNNQWPFLNDYESVQGDLNYNIIKEFGYGKNYQSTLFKEYYQQSYIEQIYGKRLWILIPPCFFSFINQKIQYQNIIDFIERGFLQIQGIRVILQMPGEIIYIPQQWYAATLNIGENLYIINKEVQQNTYYEDIYDGCNEHFLKILDESIDQILMYDQNQNQIPMHMQQYQFQVDNTDSKNNQVELLQNQVDYIQPKGNFDQQASPDYHIQCNLKQQELIDLMDSNFKDNGGWDPNEIYDVLKNIDYTTEDVQRVELNDEEFLQGLDIYLDYPRIFKSKNHKYRPQVRDILHLFSKQYMLCSYSKRSVTLTPCYGKNEGKYKDVLFEEWLKQSEMEKHNITMEELQELEGEQFYNLFGGTQWPFVEQNYETPWKHHKGSISKLLGYGKSGSGVPFHKHSDVLNEVIYGQKLWFLAPPCHDFDFNDRGMSMKFFNEKLYKQKGIVVILQQPGEILYLPKFWYHSTLNIGETLCVANFNDIDSDSQENEDLYSCVKNKQQQQIHESENMEGQLKNNNKRYECDPSNLNDCWEINT